MSRDIQLPRINVEVDADLKQRLDNVVQWGQLKGIVGALIFDLVELLESLDVREREITKALIISKRLSTTDVLESYKED